MKMASAKRILLPAIPVLTTLPKFISAGMALGQHCRRLRLSLCHQHKQETETEAEQKEEGPRSHCREPLQSMLLRYDGHVFQQLGLESRQQS